MRELHCPSCCSTNIETDEIFDISSTPFDTRDHCYAHCMDCGAKFMYDRVYDFSHYEDIELIED